jgi:hypothetical protein
MIAESVSKAIRPDVRKDESEARILAEELGCHGRESISHRWHL